MSLRNLTLVALLSAFFVSVTLRIATAAERREPFELRDGDRVVLLGGTFFERAQRYGYLETALQLRFPDRKFSVRNLGWSGDTVFAESRGIFDAPEKGYARMIEQVKGLKPTVIFLHYGGNEAFNGEAYLDTFVNQYEKLLDDLAPTGAEKVLVAPLPLWQMASPLPDVSPANAKRQVFSAAIQKLATRRSLKFVDVSAQLSQDSVPLWGKVFNRPLTEDGVTLNAGGYRFASDVFCRALTGEFAPSSGLLTLANASPGVALDRSQPVPTLAISSIPDAQRVSAMLQFELAAVRRGSIGIAFSSDVPFGRYELIVDGTLQIDFEYAADGGLNGGPSLIPAAYVTTELREAVIEKNEMYFHRWRPQNVTYLFLFRKHEQGNNAKEVEEFEEIVAKLDDRIFELKQKATEVTIEIVRVGDADATR